MDFITWKKFIFVSILFTVFSAIAICMSFILDKEEPISRYQSDSKANTPGGRSSTAPAQDLTSKKDFRGGVERALLVEDFFSRTAKLRALFSDWARLDPSAAARMIVELEPKDRDYDAVEAVALALSKKNINETFSFSMEVRDPRVGDFIKRIALNTWSQRDPAAAAQYILNKIPVDQQGHALDVFAKKWGGEKPDEALDFSEKIPDLANREYFLALAFDGYSQAKPEEAAQAWHKFTEGNVNRETLAEIISRNWSKQDPQSAAKWALTIPENDEARRLALDQSIAAWSRSDPAKASEFLGRLPFSSSTDEAIVVFVEGVSSIDPKSATEWAGSIERLQLRRIAYQKIADYYAGRDPSEGEQWLNSLNSRVPPSWSQDLARRINRDGSALR